MKTRTPLFYTLLSILICMIPSAHAQMASKAPLHISADNALEWDRTNTTFTANGKAIAKQDGVTINAEKLTANYHDNKETGNDFEIYRMTADQNVTIISNDNKAYGDQAIYNLDQKTAIMTGENLRLITPEQTITASDKFEYQIEAGKLKAIGNAMIKRQTDTIKAHTITALLSNDTKGKRTLEKLIAQGSVIITTKTEKITGNKGTYNARTEQAEITGGVTITRGPNILTGDRALVDLKTQISKIFGNKNTENGRVTGTFYPGSKKKAP